MEALVREIQDEVCAALADADGGVFREDSWRRDDGGGGRTRVLESGRVFEKAGVSVASVEGTLSPGAAAAAGKGREAGKFRAVGVSCVIHPANPFAPIAHFNYRYFEGGGGRQWWFGGGADLTPSYLFEEDARHFHRTLRDACSRHSRSFYPRFKKWCDEYFYLEHRKEARGIGGIFFDDLADRPEEELLAFVESCARAFLPSYLPIVLRRKDQPFEERHRVWQEVRRGRYVEFNLVYDRGTAFGLRSGGRVESVLMSMPPTARWGYCLEPVPGSEEHRLVEVLRRPREWV